MTGHRLGRRLAALSLLLLGLGPAPLVSPGAAQIGSGVAAGRLSVSADGRHLQTAQGQPFLYWADTGWQLFHFLDRSDARTYLRTRAQQGFTVVQAVALAEKDGLTKPNAHGDLPLRGKDPTRPLTTPGNNPANAEEYDYWDHVDYIIGEARAVGLTVALLPTWGRWVNDEPIFTPESARQYGRFLGQRYRAQPVIWVLGGDRNPSTETHKAIWRAMAAGIEEGVGGRDRALITYHPAGGRGSDEFFPNEPWLDFHSWQTGHCRNENEERKILATYQRTPVKPVINLEPIYEGFPVCHDKRNGRADATDVRNVAYWSMFAGAAGHSYGHAEVWGFHVYSGRKQWLADLMAPGVAQLAHLRTLLDSRPMLGRKPDPGLIVVSGQDRPRKVALRGVGHAWVYLPTGLPVAVAMSRLGLSEAGQGEIRAAWFNPREGTSARLGRFPASGERTFTPPTQGRGQDWVLLLEDEGRFPNLPGVSARR